MHDCCIRLGSDGLAGVFLSRARALVAHKDLWWGSGAD